jgi:predicted patatin/cPLA2 family phospholipase
MEASHPSEGVQQDAKPIKRSLILAGGGMKVAFQAGVLQVLLDEAELRFDHADGCSGGVFNLAMWCQGYSGKQIADNWRHFPPNRGIAANWKKYWKLLGADSIMTMDRFRKNILQKRWGLDWGLIRSTDRVATFNSYNFSKQKLVIREPAEMDEDFLIAGVSLPMWFPPASINGDTYIDPVYITDANLEEAIGRGATELWVIWTVSRRNEWLNGFVGNYFGIIEMAGNGHFDRMRARIDRSNEARRLGKKTREFDQHVEVKLIDGDVPLNYLVNLRSDRFTEAVELGVLKGRHWCRENDIPFTPITSEQGDPTSVTFKETMKGFLSPGQLDYEQGYEDGKRAKRSVDLRLTITVDDIDEFISDPVHDAVVTGEIRCRELGGTLPILDGRFNLMPFQGDFNKRWMFYWLPFETSDGRKLVLSGYKRLRDDGTKKDLWHDSTTLFIQVIEAQGPQPDIGRLIGRNGQADGPVAYTGIVRITRWAFVRQLTTFRAEGPSTREEFSAVTRFGLFFGGGLWDVYARRLLAASPF